MAQPHIAPFDMNATFHGGNPYPALAHYRRKSPVHVRPIGEEPEEGGVQRLEVFLFRHADCMAGLRDARLGRGQRRADGDQPPPDTYRAVAEHFMLFRDPPVHTRLRGVANKAFTPRQVEHRRARIEQIAADLAAQLRAEAQPVDLIGQFAFPLPMLAAAIDFPVDGLEAFIARVDQSTAELSAYLRRLSSIRRADPQEDLLSALIHAEAEEWRLSEEELIGTCILLLVAGHETTVNLIGNGTLALLTNPDQWEALCADPALARAATEELLRYDSPVQFTSRIAMEDIEIDGQHIPAHSVVNPMLSSANRDEAVFTDPDRLDLRRDVGRHMSFGMGIHFCLGAPLARMEGEIAFSTLAHDFPGLSLATTEPRWRPGAVFHGLAELPLHLE